MEKNKGFRWWVFWVMLGVAAIPIIITVLATLVSADGMLEFHQKIKNIGNGIAFSIVITLILFAGNSQILHFSAKTFPWESSKISHRLLLSLFGTVGFACSAMLITTFIWLKLIGPYYGNQNVNSIYFNNLLFGVALTLLVSSIHEGRELFLKWKNQLINAEHIKQEKLQAQLSFLKSQVNPHFLFNSLNSIFFLIQKNPEEAQKALIQLSEILSHSLYKSQNEWISASEEWKFIETYLSLEKLRQGESLHLQMKVNHKSFEDIYIPPMLLLGFVENALKHGHLAGLEVCEIYLSLEINAGMVCFRSENPYNKAAVKTDESGIGLQNSRERLQLLFGNAAQLNTQTLADRFVLYASWPVSTQNMPYTHE
jgi:two-component system LytT family sensor kinase